MFRDLLPRGLAADDRGLSIGIFAFVAMIVVAALLYTLMEPAASEIFAMNSDRASTQEVSDAIALRKQIFEGLLFYGLFLAGLTLTARAVLESRRPG